MGSQAVLFSWLVVQQLNESAAFVGIAQMAVMIPVLFLVLPVGVLAERVDRKRLLLVLHLLAPLPMLAMAAVIAAGHLSFTVLIAYAIVCGTFTAFTGPPRDAMLADLTSTDMQNWISLSVAMQFGMQVVGYMLAVMADQWGAVPVLLAQAGVLWVGAYMTWKLPSKREHVEVLHDEHDDRAFQSVATGLMQTIGSGVSAALKNASLRPVLLLNFFIGFFFVASFMVLIPLNLRERFEPGAWPIALSSSAFTVGLLLMTITISRLKHFHNQGPLLSVGPLVGCLVMVGLGSVGNFPAWLLLMAVWGMGAGLSMTLSRVVVQMNTPAAWRGRIMAVYQLAIFGSSPLGALYAGWLASVASAAEAMIWNAILCIVVQIGLMTVGGLWKVRAGLNNGLSVAASPGPTKP